jgi:hypothetical protein
MAVGRRAVIALAMMLALGAGFARGQDSDPPTDTDVETALQAYFAAPREATNGSIYDEVVVDWTPLKRGEPHQGDSYMDGTPANTVTTVYPISAEYVVHRTVISDRTESMQKYRGKYAFFKDEFGEWKFSAYSNEPIR